MSFSSEKKNSIVLYLLDKIHQGDSSIVKKTADAFDITPATIYKYIDELIGKKVLEKKMRGKYELVKKYKAFFLKRSAGELSSEQVIFSYFLRGATLVMTRSQMRELRKAQRARKKELDKEYSLSEPLTSSDKRVIRLIVVLSVICVATWLKPGIMG